jgi:gliding motility-associated-like protein
MIQFSRHIIILFCFLFILDKIGLAQNQSISGRDFWIMISPSSYYNPDSILLYAIGDTTSVVSVDNDYFDYHIEFQVFPGQATLIKIPFFMVMFESSSQNNNHSFRGVRINSSHNIFLYMQNRSIIPDYILWLNECHYYILSPLLLNQLITEKMPVLPLEIQARKRFPEPDEDWWFTCPNGLNTSGGDHNSRGGYEHYYVTAIEDSTMVYFSFLSENQNNYADSVMLSKGESFYANPQYDFLYAPYTFTFHTNCKPVISMTGTSTMRHPLTGDGLVPDCWGTYFPFAQSHAYQGKDYLCKKPINNRFDKGISYFKYYENSLWNGNVTRYMYNTIPSEETDSIINQLSFFDLGAGEGYTYKKLFREYAMITGNHRGLWGSISSYVSVPYTYLRSSILIPFFEANGPFYFFYKESAPGYPHFGILQDSVGCAKIMHYNAFVSAQPTDRMVKNWVYPTTRNNVKRIINDEDTESLDIDTLYADVQIYVHENGLNTTYFNGQLLPSEVFDSFPMTNGDYYVTQVAFYNDDIPEIIRISNVNGFSAYVDEFGYNVLPVPGEHPEINDITKVYYDHHGASGCFYTDYPSGNINIAEHNYDTVHRCLGDTLDLLVEHNPDSVPVEWIVDGVSHLGDGYSFLLTALDTLTVQCVLLYDCPDTTTTFVAVVLPPVINVAHDTILCSGATLSAEQPSALSYLWSNGATTPSITVDSAGMFLVAVTNIGCRAESDSFHVSLYGQSSVDFGNDSILCELASLLLDATQPHPAQYLWQDGGTNTTYTVYEDGDYWVVISDHCLGASDSINIGYLNDFTVSLGPDTVLCEGGTLTLSPGVPYCDYLWQDGSSQPVYLVRGPGTYSVEVSNKCFSHWDAVNVDYEQCAQEIFLPNAFTPGADGLNSVFLPIFSYPDEIEEYRMEIYNRWGGLIFHSEEKTFGWDGTNATEGVYAVVVHYKTRSEKAKTVTGNVTVVR